MSASTLPIGNSVRTKRCLLKFLSCKGLYGLTFACIFCLLILLFPAVGIAQTEAPATGGGVGMTIKPTLFDFQAGKGQKIVAPVTVTNSQDQPMQIKLYLGDWVRDSLGDHIYSLPGTLPVSCAGWIKLSDEFVEVPPHGQRTFDLTMSTPDSENVLKSMRWAMLFVEFAEEKTIPKTSQPGINTVVVKRQRIGLHIYQTPPNLTRKEVKLLSFNQLKGQKSVYRLTFQNTGDLQLNCKSYMELTSLDEQSVTNKVESSGIPVFPGQRRVIDITLPERVGKGKYNVIAAVDAGEDVPLEAAQEEIEVK